MKKYVRPASEVINIITEGTLAASRLGTHDELGNKQQMTNKKSLWDESSDILGR